ncbi:ABC transporter permease [Agaribacter flavus]|uniref:ABC transporter permease n=1 Tax=Agaribacter flavus TaxID=1902781 RepID=A0ABV7FTX1_9ALTE
MFLHYLDLSWRSFKRTPMVTILMVLAIATGIGITMTSLSVYHMMAMDPMPHKSSKLFHPQLNTSDEGPQWWTEDNLPHQMTYKDAMNLYRAEIPRIKTPSMRTGFSVNLNSPEVKPFIESVRMTGRVFFNMFEFSFIHGSSWSADQEDRAAYVTVISRSMSERLYGTSDSVGRDVYFDDHVFKIVGVYEDFDYHVKFYDLTNGAFNRAENAVIPITLIPVLKAQTWGNSNGWKYEEINSFEDELNSELVWLQFWAQLDTPEEEAEYRAFLTDYLREQGTLGRFEREEVKFALRNLTEWMEYNKVVTEDNRILVSASFMFLVVCLANILGLLLGKFLRRVPEVGVRRALGASKRQVFFQHLVEVGLLGFIGGVIGIGIAQLGLWGVRATYSYYSALATMDVSMLLAAPSIAIGACLIAGMYPAWLVCRTNPAICLKTQ